MKLGVQLYGCMKLYNEDPEGFLRAVRAAGYDLVEPCVSFGGPALPFAWPAEELDTHVARAAACGLGVDSCHVFAREFWTAAPEMLAAAAAYGFRRFVVGWRGAPERAALDEFAAHCRETAAVLADHGLELWLHNNAQEIADKIDGVSAYEYILRASAGRLGAQVDTGWVVCGGADLADFLNRNADCIRSIHHKDVRALTDADGRTDNVALGRGIVDTKAAYDFAVARGLGQIVDQDNSLGSMLDDLAESVRYLNELEKQEA